MKRLALFMIPALLTACGDLAGFGGDVPPLTTITIDVTGTVPGPAPVQLQAALVWGAQFLIEPLCILPSENAETTAVYAQGCRDPFGFVPDRVAANVPVELGVPAQLSLFQLPSADVMVGDVTARVAYASIVIYDDRNSNGTLDLTRFRRPRTGGEEGGEDMPPESVDVVYGASFVSMTEPDQRIAFREGGFLGLAFYPRAGCGDPLPGFSVLGAGGFSAQDAITASLAGKLPQEDPATCSQATVAAAPITVPLRPTEEVREVACTERRTDSSTRYREPPTDAPDLTNRVTACAHLPSFGTPPSDVIQLLVSSRSDDVCKGLTHFVLRGCDNDPNCGDPEWDHSAAPPSWWPCPLQ